MGERSAPSLPHRVAEFSRRVARNLRDGVDFTRHHEERNPSPNYLDVMSVVVALMPGNQFRADYYNWTFGWKEVALSEDGKNLLPDFRLVQQKQYWPPHSPQVETLRDTLEKAEVLKLGNPRYRHYTLLDSKKGEILEANQDLLALHGEKLRRMAGLLAKHLLPKEQ